MAAATEDNQVIQRDITGLRDQVTAQEDQFRDVPEESERASELIGKQKLEAEEAQLALEDAKKKHAELQEEVKGAEKELERSSELVRAASAWEGDCWKLQQDPMLAEGKILKEVKEKKTTFFKKSIRKVYKKKFRQFCF